MNNGDLARSLEALDRAQEESQRASEPNWEHGVKMAEPDAVMRQLAINLQAFARNRHRVSEDDRLRILERTLREVRLQTAG